MNGDRPVSTLRIRQARPVDKEAVFRFCENTWEWGDYILQVWDRWLDEPDSKLLVATIDSQPVAIGHMVMLAHGEAWLEGLRVDSAHRQVGLATRLTRRLLREAQILRAEVIRFTTSSLNTTVHRIATKLGFTRVTSIFPNQAEASKVKTPLRSPKQADLSLIISFLQNSTVFSAMGGLYSTGWRFHNLNLEQLQARLQKSQVRTVGEQENIGALAIIEPGYPGEGLVATYIDGQSNALKTLALGLRSEAARYEPSQISARLPEIAKIQRAFRSAGFNLQTEHSFWIYQRFLHSGPGTKTEE